MKWTCKDGVKDCLFCDGGIFQNYPITYFDDEKFGVIPVNGSCFNNETLGLKLDSSDRIEVLKNHGKPQGSQIKNIISFTDSVIDSLMNCMDNYYRSSDDNIRTVYIDTLGVNTTQFDINLKLKNDLFKSGYDSIIEFFNKKGLHL